MVLQRQPTPVAAPGPVSQLVTDTASNPDPLGADALDASHAPPVVAVVVTHNAGPWLEECLASLGAQDYPNLSVLVIDAGSTTDPLPRIAGVLADAYVRHLGHNPGFGAAANEVLQVVEGASFYVVCHDDVLLDPSAVRALVEEAFRSNAGVAGPKLVSWGAPGALLQVGLSADKTGVMAPLVERGELDQEQHDRVRDVFAVPGACTLVRADLFETLGGFDPAITFLGEDLDLCWRAQVAGSRVIVVPAARAQHREELETRRGVDDRRRLFARHRLRTMLTCYGVFHLVRVLPQAALFTLIEAVYALAAGRAGQTVDVLGAWSWNFRRLGDVRRRRRALRAVRGLRDAEVRRLQQRGSARLTAFIRGELGGSDRVRTSLSDAGRGLTGSLQAGPRQLAVLACVAVAAVVLLGTRELIGDRLPAFASLARFDDGPLALLREYASGWRSAGLGSEAPAPTAFALLGLAGLTLLGSMGVLQQLLVLGALPAGLLGVWRLTRPLGSPRARAVGLVVYAAVPLPYDALARGRWGGLLLYAAAPWILARLLAATGEEPFDAGEQGAGWRRRLAPVVGLGILVALVAAFVPLVVLQVPFVALALVAGSLLSSGGRGALRALALAVGASLVALVLHLPWSLEFLPVDGGGWAAMAGISPLGTDDLGTGELLRFETGRVGLSALGWGVPLAGALALLIGRRWRFAWAARAWVVAVACWALVWAGGRGLTGLPLPPAEVLVAPAAAALALAVALGVVAFERDLSGYGFGVRQVAALVATAGVVLATVPVALAAIDGDWGTPDSDFARSLAFMEAEEVAGAGDFRVLWLGDPEILPLAGYRLGDGLAYGLSRDGAPGITERWAATSGPTSLVADALRLAADGGTERLGRLLGPLGIRYVVLSEQAAPARDGTRRRPVPQGVRATIAQQLDLRSIDVDPALTIYENAAWVPVRAALPADAAAVVDAPDPFPATVGLDLSAAAPVLTDAGPYTRFRGAVGPGPVYLAEASSPRWELRTGGEVVERERAFGWANAFSPDGSGDATLRYRTSPLRWLAIAGQVAVWFVAVWFVVRNRRGASS
ncbi:MAG: glycosyltransferase [Acidimicrobiales bacterium]